MALICCVVACPVIARADAGEVALGPRLEVASPFAMRAAAAARLGVSDWAAVEAHAGGGLDETGAFARLGAVAALDVFTWVPEVFLGAGVGAADGGTKARGLLEVRLRGFFAAQGSLTFAGGVEWDGERSFVLGSLTVWL
ncbi:MAG: hypothetical protein HYZ27_00920, partial [Deltaproteobacteria bacterium]|nr:hypothetical protein [Deltaproteobacteria bacterium]